MPSWSCFALHASSAQNTILSPTELHYLDVFIWLPDHFPGAADGFLCSCGENLTLNGWNDIPITKWVKSLPPTHQSLDLQKGVRWLWCKLPRHWPLCLVSAATPSSKIFPCFSHCLGCYWQKPYVTYVHSLCNPIGSWAFFSFVGWNVPPWPCTLGELLFLSALTASVEFVHSQHLEFFSTFADKDHFAGSVPSKHTAMQYLWTGCMCTGYFLIVS